MFYFEIINLLYLYAFSLQDGGELKGCYKMCPLCYNFTVFRLAFEGSALQIHILDHRICNAEKT